MHSGRERDPPAIPLRLRLPDLHRSTLLRKLGSGLVGCGSGDDRDDVQIGPNDQLLTANHPINPGLRRDKCEAAEPIVIIDNVWLGGGVIVCPGVRIGANTVVGAGAVVVRELPADVVAVGNPARVIKTFEG